VSESPTIAIVAGRGSGSSATVVPAGSADSSASWVTATVAAGDEAPESSPASAAPPHPDPIRARTSADAVSVRGTRMAPILPSTGRRGRAAGSVEALDPPAQPVVGGEQLV